MFGLEESLKFYQEVVGLELDKRFQAGPGVEIAFLGKGETKIELICREGSGKVNIGRYFCGFEVDSVDK